MTVSGDRSIVRGACPQDCPDTCAFLYHVEGEQLVDVTGDPDAPDDPRRPVREAQEFRRAPLSTPSGCSTR